MPLIIATVWDDLWLWEGRQVNGNTFPWDRVDTHPDRTSLYPPCLDVGPALYDKCPLGAILSPVILYYSLYFSRFSGGGN